MKNLAHSASFDSVEKNAPSKSGIKQLEHNREADDLRARLEGATDAGVAHVVRLAALPDSKPIFL
jgi:hypothetical protein